VTWDNSIDTDYYVLGNIAPYDMQMGNAALSGSFDARFISGTQTLAAHYLRPFASTPVRCSLRFTATGSIIEAALRYSVEVFVARAVYTAAPAPISGSDHLKGITVSFDASKDTTTSKILTVAVQNITTAY
jgi:hypothetical protein